jgi:hypothetical protein
MIDINIKKYDSNLIYEWRCKIISSLQIRQEFEFKEADAWLLYVFEHAHFGYGTNK